MYNDKYSLHIITVPEFQTKFLQLIADKTSFFTYVHGSYDEKTNKSWCSDCDEARPLVEYQMNKLDNKNILFVKLPIETSAEYKNKEFVYRTNELIKIQRIPSLIFFNKGEEFGRLVEDELFEVENLNKFVDDCLAEASK